MGTDPGFCGREIFPSQTIRFGTTLSAFWFGRRASIIANQHCPLCDGPGDEILWEDDCCRVIRVGGQEGIDYPGFCRVVWRQHVREMSDLADPDRRRLMALVFATESALRRLYAPEKINLASLGNLVPHLHWHVIPRFRDDPTFPAAIWAPGRQDSIPAASRPPVGNLALRQAISLALAEESAA